MRYEDLLTSGREMLAFNVGGEKTDWTSIERKGIFMRLKHPTFGDYWVSEDNRYYFGGLYHYSLNVIDKVAFISFCPQRFFSKYNRTYKTELSLFLYNCMDIPAEFLACEEGENLFIVNNMPPSIIRAHLEHLGLTNDAFYQTAVNIELREAGYAS